MTREWSRTCRAAVIRALVLIGLVVRPVEAQWTQWGGPNRNFMVETSGLANEWPDDGPAKLWSRELGEGYSAIIVDDGILYTMYRKRPSDEAEYSIALDARSGRTIWEHKNASPFTPRMAQYGPGPHSTPLIVGKRLFTIGTNAVMHCLDKKTGDVLWRRDLPGEFDVHVPLYGYGCSPIAYKKTVIVVADRARKPDRGGYYGVSGEGPSEEKSYRQSIMAFDQKTGQVAWENLDIPVDYSSPILINFRGEPQMVFFMRKEVVGVDPDDGNLLWSSPFTQIPDENIATPIWNGSDMLFVSAAYSGGGRAIKLVKEDDRTVAKELWYSRKLRILQGNAILIDDYIYGSTGDFGQTLFVCMNIRTGEIPWRRRDFRRATCVYGDGKFIILDEYGQLALATATPEGLTVHSKCDLPGERFWTIPTLADRTLYVRDRKNIVALELG
ncbi:MAG: PQQ-like beta-propeller repeat protein [Phycisphaerales bacterium]|nr:MAG: PQQ-like beta-propeller repeat protein [Phycisphaerales bacterium]